MRWERHVASIGEMREVYRVLVGKTEGKRPIEKPGVDGRIILRWIFRKWYVFFFKFINPQHAPLHSVTLHAIAVIHFCC
jgi:hypothetical protein